MIHERRESRSRPFRILTLIPPGEETPPLAAFLARAQLEVVSSASAREAIGLLSSEAFALFVVGLPVPDISVGSLVGVVRDLDSPGPQLPLILLARGPQLEAARVFESDSIRVLGRHEPAENLQHAIADALGIAIRLSVRIPVRLELGVETGPALHYCETRNLSRSGMLISSSRPLPVGSQFDFELILPHPLDPLTGQAKVVRQSDPRREDTTGFGARFVDLALSESERIDAFLRREARAH